MQLKAWRDTKIILPVPVNHQVCLLVMAVVTMWKYNGGSHLKSRFKLESAGHKLINSLCNVGMVTARQELNTHFIMRAFVSRNPWCDRQFVCPSKGIYSMRTFWGNITYSIPIDAYYANVPHRMCCPLSCKVKSHLNVPNIHIVGDILMSPLDI